MTILNTNPVILDARGEATIWGEGSYRQVLTNAFGVIIWDKIVTTPTDYSEADGSSLIGFTQDGAGAVARTVQDKLRERVSVLDFGAVGDGAAHLLSERYASLADAQIDYPFVSSLTQTLDWAGAQAAVDYLAGRGGGTVLGAGRAYRFSDDVVIPPSNGDESFICWDGELAQVMPSRDMDALFTLTGDCTYVRNTHFDNGAFECTSAVRLTRATDETRQIVVADNTFYGFDYHFHSVGDSWVFSRNRCLGHGIASVYSANRGLNCEISSNYIYGFTSGGDGIVLTKASASSQQPEGVRIFSNTVFATGMGKKALRVLAGLSIHISDNIFDQCHGVDIGGPEGYAVADIQSSGNWVGPNNTYAGADPLLRIQNTAEFRSVSDTIVTPFGGVAIESSCTNVGFVAPRIRLTGNSAVGISNKCSTASFIAPFFNRVSSLTSAVDFAGNGVVCSIIGGRFFLPENNTGMSNVWTIGVTGDGIGPSSGNLRVRFGNGSDTEPSVSFKTAPNTGLFLYASGVLGITGGGIPGIRIGPNGNVVVGPSTIATNAIDGFLHIPRANGAPTGTPTQFSSRAPLYVDSANNRFYVYVNGQWRYAELLVA